MDAGAGECVTEHPKQVIMTPALSWIEVSPLLIIAIPALCLLAPDQLQTTVLGMTASTIAFVMFVPQAVRVWRTRHDAHALLGLSLSTQFLILANATIWGVYALKLGEFWVGAPGIINAPLALTVIALTVRSRMRAKVGDRPGAG